ncbi:MAG: cupin domain-containing protein [Candidatus Bathyarchaeia archaeon]
MDVKRVGDVKPWIHGPGVSARVLMSGRHIMLLLVDMEAGSIIPRHKHPNEQLGICLKGRASFKTDAEEFVVEEGMTYRFNPDEEHLVKALMDSRFIDVFSPPRNDYLKRQIRESG